MYGWAGNRRRSRCNNRILTTSSESALSAHRHCIPSSSPFEHRHVCRRIITRPTSLCTEHTTYTPNHTHTYSRMQAFHQGIHLTNEIRRYIGRAAYLSVLQLQCRSFAPSVFLLLHLRLCRRGRSSLCFHNQLQRHLIGIVPLDAVGRGGGVEQEQCCWMRSRVRCELCAWMILGVIPLREESMHTHHHHHLCSVLASAERRTTRRSGSATVRTEEKSAFRETLWRCSIPHQHCSQFRQQFAICMSQRG